MLEAFADAQPDHHAIRQGAQRQARDGPDLDTAEQHRRTDAHGARFWHFDHNAQPVKITRVGNRRFLQFKVTTRLTAARFNVDIGLQNGVQMLNARCRNLRRDDREACPRPGKVLHVFRIKYRRSLHFIARGDQRQFLDLTDINP